MHLVQDVVDHVIDQLYNPEDCFAKCYLQATSLVSTIWVKRSQHHLFSTVDFHDHRRVKRWCCRIEPDHNGVSRHVRALTVGERSTAFSPLAVRYIKAAIPHLASFKNLRKFGLGYRAQRYISRHSRPHLLFVRRYPRAAPIDLLARQNSQNLEPLQRSHRPFAEP